MINISIRVSLQRFKLNRKKSATKITHNESASVCTVVHEIEAIVMVSQTEKSLKVKSAGGWHPAQLEPAHNGKISLRSPLSNVKGFPFFTGKIIVISL